MKFLIPLFGFLFMNVSAQTTTFGADGRVVQAGFGLGGWSYSDAVSLPAFAVSYDHGIMEDLGPGTLGVGIEVGVKSARYKYEYDGTKYVNKWRNIIIMPRATYHPYFGQLPNLDLYGGAGIGIRFYSFTDDFDSGISTTNVNVVPGIFIGTRYYIQDNIGIWGELGYGVSYLRLGACYKL